MTAQTGTITEIEVQDHYIMGLVLAAAEMMRQYENADAARHLLGIWDIGSAGDLDDLTGMCDDFDLCVLRPLFPLRNEA
jgi:hypothetical protein